MTELKSNIIFISILILFSFTACEEKMGIVDSEDVEYQISKSSIPVRINISYLKEYSLQFKVTHPDGLDAINNVIARFYTQNSQQIFVLDLFDDGSTVNPEGGDVIAKDGIYSNIFLSDSMIFSEGIISVVGEVSDNNEEKKLSESVDILVAFNEAPTLISVSNPDTFYSGISAELVSVIVKDTDGIDDITSVKMKGFSTEFGNFEEALSFQSQFSPDSGSFGNFYDSSFAAGRKGSYELEYYAFDLSEEESNTLTSQIFLENFPPESSNLEIPDSMIVPDEGVNAKLITILITDPQSLADIDSVYFNSFLPNGNPSSNNPFLMHDNGLPYNPDNPVAVGDQVANDGIFSITIGLPPGTTEGVYKFDFFSRDKVDNFSVGPQDSIVVYK